MVFIGAGAVAQRHARMLLGFEDVAIVGVADVAPTAARAFAALTGAAVFEERARLLDEAAPDAVYVCVPPFAHGEPERELIDRGLPFLVEKPLSIDLATAEGLAAAVAARGLVTATGYHWRYLEVVERTGECLADTPARLAVGAWLDKVPPAPWWTQRSGSGGQTIEQTTHLLDVALELMGEVVHVYALGARTRRPAFPDADVDDVTSATLRFASGAVASVASTCLLRAKHRAGLELFCDGRRLELTEDRLVVDEGDGEPVEELCVDPTGAKRQVDRDFIDAVRGEPNRVRAPYDVALRTHRLACALARSAEEGVPIDVAAVP